MVIIPVLDEDPRKVAPGGKKPPVEGR